MIALAQMLPDIKGTWSLLNDLDSRGILCFVLSKNYPLYILVHQEVTSTSIFSGTLKNAGERLQPTVDEETMDTDGKQRAGISEQERAQNNQKGWKQSHLKHPHVDTCSLGNMQETLELFMRWQNWNRQKSGWDTSRVWDAMMDKEQRTTSKEHEEVSVSFMWRSTFDAQVGWMFKLVWIIVLMSNPKSKMWVRKFTHISAQCWLNNCTVQITCEMLKLIELVIQQGEKTWLILL